MKNGSSAPNRLFSVIRLFSMSFLSCDVLFCTDIV